MTTVLLLGFGPFPGAPRNPSAELVRALGRRRRPALASARIITAVLPTTFAAVEQELPDLLRRHDPDIVLFFGLASRAKFARVESRAVNLVTGFYPDAARRKLSLRRWKQEAPSELRMRAPIRAIMAASRAAGLPMRWSRDAGRYICNAALFASLDIACRTGRPKQIAFVHIPRPRAPLRADVRKRAARPTMASLIHAGEAVLIPLLAAARRG